MYNFELLKHHLRHVLRILQVGPTSVELHEATAPNVTTEPRRAYLYGPVPPANASTVVRGLDCSMRTLAVSWGSFPNFLCVCGLLQPINGVLAMGR